MTTNLRSVPRSLTTDPRVDRLRKRIITEAKEEQVRSMVRLLDLLIEFACASRASDLHVDPGPHKLLIRLRVDGSLDVSLSLPMANHAELVARLKVLAGLRTDEHVLPQDGRFRHKISTNECVDIRISTLPTYYGENAVLRLLRAQSELTTLGGLGVSEEQALLVHSALNRKSGLILVTGPTGSGKTTTLYVLMRMLSECSLSLVTIEDPLEYELSCATQIPARADIGLTFARAFRSVLRQDPDVIMLGEIRDVETAKLAVHAALTGHLVLSSLHTSDAASVIPRLMDLGIEPYLIASTLSLVVSQRLARTVCGDCRSEEPLASSMNAVLLQAADCCAPSIQKCAIGRGCISCGGSGHRGRVGLYELLPMSVSLEEAVVQRSRSRELRAVARQDGRCGLVCDGLAKLAQGRIPVSEVLPLTYA